MWFAFTRKNYADMHKIKEKMNNNVNPTGSIITKMLGMHNQNFGGYTQWHVASPKFPAEFSQGRNWPTN